MKPLKSIDLSALPEQARREVYDFYLFIKQRCKTRAAGESALLSEDSLADGWLGQTEDEAWKNFQ
ncbi:MAG: DUF2281 domain-containing protein [Gammaproteobacteria bacterium]|nr:DUF2281 domain-containing protein [Gammaproteobacteria bacterium]